VLTGVDVVLTSPRRSEAAEPRSFAGAASAAETDSFMASVGTGLGLALLTRR
jgi:hypothetical protein